MQEAIARMSEAVTITSSMRLESRAIQGRIWSQVEIDLIRLAAISRRQALAFRNDSCTVSERLRKGRPQTLRKPRPPKERQ